MDNQMALVACDGRWIPATPEQFAVIKKGKDACVHQEMREPYRTAIGDCEFVLGGPGMKSYVKNRTSGKCREVIFVPKNPLVGPERKFLS